MRTDLRSPKLTKAIRHAIDEARLAYEFCPSSYTWRRSTRCTPLSKFI